MPDQELECIDCKAAFTFTEADQLFYKERDFKAPKRCKMCRAKKKIRFAEKDNQPQE
jgi:hypothetical protein